MSFELELLIDLHRDGARLGPGSDADTRRALAMTGLMGRRGLTVADVGCGTGASVRVLAQSLDADIAAVDLLPAFLETLRARLSAEGLLDRVTPLAASMDQLPFAPGSLDLLWSEGAIYTIGFERGLALWRPLLKPGGVLAVSELTWLTAERPADLEAHWAAEYPEVGLASAKISALERAGYTLLGYFPLPAAAWLERYYEPLEARFDAFLARHGGSAEAQTIVAAERREIDLYRRYSAHVSYGFYIARP